MKQELIGRKVKGFYFDGQKHAGLSYNSEMNNLIGKVGVIKDYAKFTDSYEVQFEKVQFWYPAELIEKHLVEDDPLDSLPMLGEGVLCEVWDDEENTFIRFVCARTPNGYLAWKFMQTKESIEYKGVTYWENARPIEPVKQYTKEQLEEMIGHPFELI